MKTTKDTTAPLPIYTPQDYINKYLNLPREELRYLFYSLSGSLREAIATNTPTERVHSYELSFDDAWDLLKPDQPTFANQLRIHLGVNPDFDVDAPVPPIPALTLIAQAYSAFVDADVPSIDDLGPNPKILNPLKNSDSPNLPMFNVEISSLQAYDFEVRWRDMLSDEQLQYQLLATFDNYLKRVKASTFSQSDVASIKYFLLANQDATTKPSVFFNLASNEFPTEQSDPFQFRFVIQVGHTAADTEYFEYSRPCPPICDQVIIS
ncbi:MAG: hypothetical protein AAFZ15_10875 [Bacteroidota bacterium]